MVLDFHKFSSMVQLVRTHLKVVESNWLDLDRGYSEELKFIYSEKATKL